MVSVDLLNADQSLADASRPQKTTRTAPRFDARERLHRLTGVDLTRIDGIDAPMASVRIGLDMTGGPLRSISPAGSTSRPAARSPGQEAQQPDQTLSQHDHFTGLNR